MRGRPFEKALYWSDTNSFGPRAYFVTGQQPAKLSVENIQLDDEGVSTYTYIDSILYTLLVHFANAFASSIVNRFIAAASTFRTHRRVIIELI